MKSLLHLIIQRTTEGNLDPLALSNEHSFCLYIRRPGILSGESAIREVAAYLLGIRLISS